MSIHHPIAIYLFAWFAVACGRYPALVPAPERPAAPHPAPSALPSPSPSPSALPQPSRPPLDPARLTVAPPIDQLPPPERGASYAHKRQCPVCHDPGDGSMSGRSTPVPGTDSFAPNLTPDIATGLGAWTDQQIVVVIRTGVDAFGQTLCMAMPRFADMSDSEAADIVSYLRSLAPVERDDIPNSRCPGDITDTGP
jgi:hypothetical protein